MTNATGESIDIVCASDEGYAMPLCAALASAIHFIDPTVALRVHLLDAGIRPETRAKLRRSLHALAPGLELTFIDIANASEIRGQGSSGHLNWVTLSKLLIPKLLPTVDKVVWLDCDLIVCDDLIELWRMPMHGKSILAVQESTIGHTLPFAADYGVALDAPYFNSGVMVLDLAALRRADFTPRALAVLARHPRLRYLDQDVFNLLCAGDWAPLERRWNLIVAAETDTITAIERARRQPHPSIVHYASVPKPWFSGYGYQRLYSSYFYYALDLTEWRGWRPPVRARQVLRAHLPGLVASLTKVRATLSGLRKPG